MPQSKLSLSRQNDAFHFAVSNADGATISLDGSPAIGGENKGLRPMELLLAGVAGCSAIDVGLILKKQRQQVEAWDIEITGEREAADTATPWKKVHLHFIFAGPLDPNKVRRAIDLSLETYCSAALTLKAFATITYSFAINGETYESS
ncbi:MAG: OsmC family peroxiredoxin [Bacteroidetes bacterium]|nr:MAG: OsmC family peroxiredoxin [Bacteroidota bacterium]